MLTEAALRCGTIDEVIAFLGARPYHQLRSHLFKRFAQFDIDVSHLPRPGRPGRKGKPRPTHDELRRAVADSVSISGALRRLGRPDNGSQRACFQQWVAEAGIDVSHFLGQAHQRGKTVKQRKSPREVLVKHEGKRRTQTHLLRRALWEIGVPEECAECGVGPSWGGKPMTLEVDHINGDWSDDRAENLRFLCPNCHAVTGTWCRGRVTAERPVEANLSTTGTASPVG
ncbi:HNH endonuclease signature motif containing protein [Streptomyces megasporus]|uniref:HNH endonuclease signature motif containing protein n=1 Tax=Streptomyces megasporus TaxID=44060 RepID=UPI000997FD04|nr:HNH endonuclease signature motif containing protein [Streptomyces megasporus]